MIGYTPLPAGQSGGITGTLGVNAWSAGALPPGPASFVVGATGSTSLFLNWQITGAAVVVEAQRAGGAWDTIVFSGTTSYFALEATGLLSDTAYDARVRFVSPESAWSTIEYTYTGAPLVPFVGAVPGDHYGQVLVTWGTGIASINSVNIYVNDVLVMSGLLLSQASQVLTGLSPDTEVTIGMSGMGYYGDQEGSKSYASPVYPTAGSAPTNINPPVIYDGAGSPSTSVTFLGDWSGEPSSFSYTYQWYLDGSLLSGATADNINCYEYTGGSGFFKCSVTATNIIGSTSADSNNFYYTP